MGEQEHEDRVTIDLPMAREPGWAYVVCCGPEDDGIRFVLPIRRDYLEQIAPGFLSSLREGISDARLARAAAQAGETRPWWELTRPEAAEVFARAARATQQHG